MSPNAPYHSMYFGAPAAAGGTPPPAGAPAQGAEIGGPGGTATPAAAPTPA